eukprot:NODE_786_length_4265_cov_0.251320.p1 type:complete len:519 gc:universal NODE_786_length_4265_cov_0.251320:2321-765(-)
MTIWNHGCKYAISSSKSCSFCRIKPPLQQMRVICHLDLDAFYAAVEHVRKNIPKNEPLGVQQWNHLIAVNYAARAFNVKRMHVDDAKKLCPQLHCIHVDTIGEGKFKKAQLGPYRRASVRILDIIKRYTLKFERASIDEVFIDLTDLVKCSVEKNAVINYDVIGTIYNEPINSLNNHFAHAAMIIHKIRCDIEKELGYTASAGISSNKTVAKLCSSMNKPNKQTIVPESQILNYMKAIPIRKIRMLGGVVCEELKTHCPFELAGEMWDISLSQFVEWLGGQGEMVYNLVRGIDNSEVVPRHIIKSHMVAKSEKFNTFKDIEGVCLVLTFELYERLLEDYEENQRWPRTITLTGSWNKPIQKSKSVKFAPFSKSLQIEDLYTIVMNLLESLRAINGDVVPCHRISIQLNNLETISTNSIARYFTPRAEEIVSESLKNKNSAGENLDHSDTRTTLQKEGRGTSSINKSKSSNTRLKPASVYDMLCKPKRETFHCPTCNDNFDLEKVDDHSSHQNDNSTSH